MPDDIQKLIHDVAELNRKVGNMVRVGPVKEVKAANGEQKLRMVTGPKGENGEESLSPWLHTSTHRGKAREERKFKEGQNVMMIAPDGDFRQAQLFPYAESKQLKRPDHASDDAETYQYEKLRVTKKGDTYEVWLADGQDTDKGGNPRMKVRLSDKGITGRYGADIRFAASQGGSKVKAGKKFVTVTKQAI